MKKKTILTRSEAIDEYIKLKMEQTSYKAYFKVEAGVLNNKQLSEAINKMSSSNS